jgi:hypothetical protein
LVTISNNWYEDVSETYCIPNPPAQCTDEKIIYYKVTSVDVGYHESDPSNTVGVRVEGSGIDKKALNPEEDIPNEYSLAQNYPNPFNPTTTIDYSIKSAGLVTLKIYDMLGTEVVSLVNELKDSGNYSVTFNASNLPSGIYFYNLTSGNFVATKKLIFLK